MFMRYVHTEDHPVRTTVEAVASRRQSRIGGVVSATDTVSAPMLAISPGTLAEPSARGEKPPGFGDGHYRSRSRTRRMYRPNATGFPSWVAVMRKYIRRQL